MTWRILVIHGNPARASETVVRSGVHAKRYKRSKARLSFLSEPGKRVTLGIPAGAILALPDQSPDPWSRNKYYRLSSEPF